MPVIQNFAAFMARGDLVCPPDKKKIEYSVADGPGLFVECRSSASSVPTWYLRQKNAQGTNTYKKLGTIKDLSLPQARKLAQQYKAEHLLAVKSNVVAAVAPVEQTFDAFVANHFGPHAQATIRSAKKYDQLHRIYVSPRFGQLPLSQITRRDAQALHTELLNF